ncbi:class I SAM-dependent methyltransferase [Glacieibacterium megasporae]|uniref:class I SAM-dependent methyltransferase n=1 Tax=Glacieibacterium megasporae TaxID=2835787 RepID=UPI001C1E7F0B|nr:class I SAM-dependent methyltransferase [Polymorphobacter megasporae]UAJ12759.1 class I SAM-dependent methyltransferase [Polymorphobacter megasporae]
MRDQNRPAVLAHQRFDADRSAFVCLDLASRFQRIHETNLWGALTSVSGLGSEATATAKLQADLPALLKSLGVASLLDAPCGDASWIITAGIDVDYIGVDIVPALIGAARVRTWPDPAKIRFMVADITADNLPCADAVLCRDCLVHLSFENIWRAVETFRRSGATWLITTTFSDWSTNVDIEDGDWRALNFMRPPFTWPMPHFLLDEGCDEASGGYRDKSLGVWRLRDIRLHAAAIETREGRAP